MRFPYRVRRPRPTAHTKWLAIFYRFPFPPVELNVRYVPAVAQQKLEITVIANTVEEATAKAWAQVNYQIKGGRVINSNAPPNSTFPRVGTPRIYGLESVTQIRRRNRL